MFSLLLAAPTSAATSPAIAVPTGTLVSPADLDAAHRFRRGAVLGLEFGGGFVGASGYPNDSSKIGDPNYYSASGLMLGSAGSLFLMGALTDYLSFGFWYAHASASNAHWRSNGDGGGLRLEVFPLVSLISPFRGLGLVAQFGVGAGNLTAKALDLPPSNGTQSFVTAGVFHEWSFGNFLGGHFGVGPSLEYSAIWSQPFERHGLVASARFVFYGGGVAQR